MVPNLGDQLYCVDTVDNLGERRDYNISFWLLELYISNMGLESLSTVVPVAAYKEKQLLLDDASAWKILHVDLGLCFETLGLLD